MFDNLFRMHANELFFLLCTISITISLIAIYLIKRFVPLDLRYRENSVIGYTSSLISLIYGVLVGISALFLINNNSSTQDSVLRESNSVANLYRDSNWLKEPARTQLQSVIQTYTKEVVNNEWPMMRMGKDITKDGDLIIDKIANQINSYSEANSSQFLVVHDMFQEIKALHDARQQRINMSYSMLDPELWIVILIGSVLTLCINYLFGMNFYLHSVTVIAASLMTTSMIFLLIQLDKPFQGEFIIEPDGLNDMLTLMEKNTHLPVKQLPVLPVEQKK